MPSHPSTPLEPKLRWKLELAAWLAAALGLLAGAVYILEDAVLIPVDLGRVCNAERQEHCFTEQRGRVAETRDRELIVSSDTAPYRVSVSGGQAWTDWDEYPSPGTPVVLHRWEGGNVAVVSDLERGLELPTVDEPDRFGPALLAVVLAAFAMQILYIIVASARDDARSGQRSG